MEGSDPFLQTDNEIQINNAHERQSFPEHDLSFLDSPVADLDAIRKQFDARVNACASAITQANAIAPLAVKDLQKVCFQVSQLVHFATSLSASALMSALSMIGYPHRVGSTVRRLVAAR